MRSCMEFHCKLMKMNHYRNVRHGFLSCVAAVLADTGLAQEQAASASATVELVPFVVTGEVYAFGAQKIVHVSEQDLERLQPNDLSDIFALDPSIQVGGAIGVAEKIYLRGIEDKMLNVSIDGATQAGYLSHHQSQFAIEPELLKFAEAEPGPGGAAVGPGALAGAIRFQTKSARDFLAPDQLAGLFSKASYGSNGDQIKLTGTAYGEISNRVAALVAYTYSDSNDYRDGQGNRIDFTGHTSNRAFLKIDASIDAKQSVDFSYEDLSDEGVFRHRPNFYGYFDHPVAPNKPVEMDFARETATVGYRFRSGEERIDLNAKLYHTDNQIDRVGQYRMGYESLGFDLSNATALQNHRILYGINYRDDTASFLGQGQTKGFLPFPLVYQTIPDETIEILGAFVQDEWEISDRLQASSGLRFDNYDYRDKDGQRFTNSGFSPNLGLSFAATDALDLNLSYGAAFRGVTPIDIITANEGGVTNHPSIDGEWSENMELGFQFDNGLYFLNGTIYQQQIDDVIIARGVRDNAGQLKVRGYDFALGFRREQLRSSVGVSYSNPELDGDSLIDTDFGIGTSYGRTWTANTAYTLPELQMEFGWALNFVERYDEPANTLAHKPSYTVHDLYLQWRPIAYEALAVTLTVNNAFDKSWVDQATSGYNGQLQRVAGLPEPGRDIRLSTSLTF